MDKCRHISISVIFLILILFIPCSILAQAKGKLYVVGMGPAGPDLTAPRALEIVKKYYASDMPIAIVYYAGYPDKEKVLKSCLENILQDVEKMDEKWLGLFILGKCVK